VKCIFRYLSGTHKLWLTYGEMRCTLEGFADANGSMAKDCHMISSYAFLIDGGAISWSSKCQEIISLFTTESKYIAAMHSGKEAIWLCSLLSQVFGPFKDTTVLFSNNQSTITLSYNHQYHAHTKHINM
jgi:hypothetical protein